MYKQLTVPENRRAIVTRRHRLTGVFTPGTYCFLDIPALRIELEWHDLRSPLLKSKWTRHLFESRQDIVQQHFVPVQTGPLEIAMVSVNGALDELLLPQKLALFWKDAGIINVELISIGVAEQETPAHIFSKIKLQDSFELAEENTEDWIYETQEES